MNPEIVFTQLPSRYQLEEFLLYLSSHQDQFPEVFDFVFKSHNPKSAFRALWACEKVSQRWPEWWSHEQWFLIRQMVLTTTQSGMLRLALSILNTLPLPVEPDVELINKLYDLLLQPSWPPGVQAQVIRLLHALVKDNVDMLYEFWLVVDDVAEDYNSPAFRSTRKNLLKRRR